MKEKFLAFIRDNVKLSIAVISFILILTSVIFIAERVYINNSKVEIKKLAELFATPLWHFDNESLKYYLLLITKNEEYLIARIIDQDGDILEEQRAPDIFHSGYRFVEFKQDIFYNNKRLGYIFIKKVNKNNLIYAIILIVFCASVLLWLGYKKIHKNQLDMKELLTQTFDENVSIMWIIDEKSKRVIDVNKSFLKFFLVEKKKNLIGEPLGDEKFISLEKVLKEYISKGQLINREVEKIIINNKEVSLLVSGIRIKQKNRSTVLFVALDITRKKKAEKRLADANRKLIDSARSAGQAEIATGILHNVGNVLNSATVSISMLENNHCSILSSKITKVVKLIKAQKGEVQLDKLVSYLSLMEEEIDQSYNEVSIEINNLSRSINHVAEIVAFHQKYSEKVSIEEFVDIKELVEDAIRINSEAPDRHGAIIEYHNFVDDPVMIDRNAFMQVAINLISNAKYAVSGDGVKDKKILISSRSAGENIIITVKDNGIGIDKTNLDHIFNYGFTTRSNGHGFGLHSSANLAAQISGRIFAKSDGVGRGAEFVFEIPFKRGLQDCG